MVLTICYYITVISIVISSFNFKSFKKLYHILFINTDLIVFCSYNIMRHYEL